MIEAKSKSRGEYDQAAIRDLVHEKGGTILSAQFGKIKEGIDVRCTRGHPFRITPYRILRGFWCPSCKRTRLPSVKGTIEEMRRIAEARGGECLSERYVDTYTLLHWRCKKDHEFAMRPNSVKNGSWCPRCFDERRGSSSKHTIEEMRELARAKGGRCLSGEYVNSKTEMEWECAAGHPWKTRANSILKGSWCPKCGGTQKLVLAEMQRIAHDRGGKCLSDKYVNGKTPLWWECAVGHQWEARPEKIKKGNWCPECQKREYTLNSMQEIARVRGGACLSLACSKSSDVLEWRCKDGHEWRATAMEVKRGSWCPSCARVTSRISMDTLKELAVKRGGAVLSDQYTPGVPLRLKCSMNHEWESQASTLTAGCWCPVCAGRKADPLGDLQSIARAWGGECLAQSYPRFDIKIRWRCKDGHEWEAKAGQVRGGSWCRECYMKERGNPARTAQKSLIIAEIRGGECLKPDSASVSQAIPWRCKVGHEWNASMLDITARRWCPECARKYQANKGKIPVRARAIIKEKGGMVVSITETDVKEETITVRCDKGHEWDTRWKNIVDGHWCPVCNHVKKGSIEEMQDLATLHEGTCLSKIYVNSTTKLEWRCKLGHTWSAIPGTVKKGHWCPVCGWRITADSAKYSIESMRDLARGRGGECLSESYTNCKSALQWRCKEGHEFAAKPQYVIAGTWCPVCGGRTPLTIDNMHDDAKSRGGRCLSKTYVNNTTKMVWECERGHVFEQRPQSVRCGSWCPQCAGKHDVVVKPGIIAAPHLLILSRSVMEDLEHEVSSLGNGADKQALLDRVHERFKVNLAPAIAWLRGERHWIITCLLSMEFASIKDVVEQLSRSGIDVQHTPIQAIVRQLTSVIDEVHGHNVLPAMTCILKLLNREPDGEDALQEILDGGKRRFIASGMNYYMAKPTYEHAVEVSRAISWAPERWQSTIIKSMFGTGLTPFLKPAEGKKRVQVVISRDSCPYIDIDEYVKLNVSPDPREYFGNIRMIRSDFQAAVLKAYSQFQSDFEEVIHGDITRAFSHLIDRAYPQLSTSMILSTLQDRKISYTYDPFTKADVEDYAWILGVMLSESSIFTLGEGNLYHLRLGNSNPLRLMLHAIPQVHHPSFSSEEITLSPPFVDFLKDSGALGHDMSRHPITLKNNEVFLAGFLDARFNHPKDRVDFSRGYHTRFSINLPIDLAGEWAKLVPVDMPHILVERDEARPSHGLHVFARKIPNALDGESAEKMAGTVKYFFEHVFPHCIHPRLDAIFNAGDYYDDLYGTFKQSIPYSQLLKQFLVSYGGIDLTDLLATLANEVTIPGSSQVIAYVPAWLREFNAKHGFSEADMRSSIEFFNEFIIRMPGSPQVQVEEEQAVEKEPEEAVEPQIHDEPAKLVSPSTELEKGRWIKREEVLKATLETDGELDTRSLSRLAIKHGGRCLTTGLRLARDSVAWRCAKGHDFQLTPYRVLQGSWCPTCWEAARKSKSRVTIEKLDEVARQRGGKCLSETYTPGEKVKWICGEGHEWEAKIDRILYQEAWCPECTKARATEQRRLGIDGARQLAMKKGGECLSTEYVSSKTPMQWRCQYGHVWSSPMAYIQQGSWCPECTSTRVRHTIEEMQRIARERHGACLSPAYIGWHEPHEWRCDECLTVWQNSPSRIVQGAWCPTCSVKKDLQRSRPMLPPRVRATIEDARALASTRGGKCLSDSMFDASAKLQWQCSAGHAWLASHSQTKQGKWCPDCKREADEEKRRSKDGTADSRPDEESDGNNGIVKVSSSCIVTAKKLAEITELVQKIEHRSDEAINREISKRYGDTMGAIIAHVRGNHNHDLILVTDGDLTNLNQLKALMADPGRRGISPHILVRKEFHDELIDKFQEFKHDFKEVHGRDCASFYARLVKESVPSLELFNLKAYLKGTVPYKYDPFDEPSLEANSWMLGALLSEVSLAKHPHLDLLCFKMGITNPLVFFDHVVPQVRHPSLGKKQITLSPVLVDYLLASGALDENFKRHPVTTRNNDIFLAGLCDTRLSITTQHKKGSTRLQSARLAIQLPVDAYEEWLRAIPFRLPLDVYGGLPVSPTTRAEYAPSEIAYVRKYASAYIFGRRIPESLVQANEPAAQEVVNTVKHFFEHVFPHCIHPRLDMLHDVGIYIDEQYGAGESWTYYMKAFRTEIDQSGGIDFSPLLQTINNPLVDPETNKVLMYKPTWIEHANDALGTDDKDLVRSLRRMGGFASSKNS